MLAEPVVQVEDLVADYRDKRILDGIDLTVNKGEIMAIMGRSGAGKSSLLRQILGLSRPVSGRVRVFGQDINEIGNKGLYALRRNIGVAFQGGALLTSMSVGENIELPLREHTALDDKTIQIMSRLKLELVDLSGCERMMPAELSGGMLKRVALARAIVMDPKLLFFDEPSSGLDPITTVELDDLIVRLKQAMNMTIVVITHELASALKIADRISLLANGRVIFSGPVDEVRDSKDALIQDFLNSRPQSDRGDGEDYLNRLTED